MSQVDEFFLIDKYFKNIGSKFLSKKNFILLLLGFGKNMRNFWNL